jgi:glycerol-3-phosphate dehydrogenase (NAD(P)+)
MVTVGGPSKALELVRRVPTRVLYASPDAAAREQARLWMQTAYYRVDETGDQRGLEICSALKNAYAIAIGLCDGLVAARRAEAMYNTKAALFAQALVEMARLGGPLGLHPETFYGLGGAGDLFVTGVAGRNRTFGELRGAGLPSAQVVARLQERDELTEGYAAIRWCWQYAAAHAGSDIPLLRALYRIVYEDQDVERELRAACFDPPPGVPSRPA